MKIIIIGGNAAGMSAASKARRNDPKAEIIVFEKLGTVSYGACGLPYYISDDIKNADSLIAIPVDDFRNKRKIDVRLFHEAVSFNARKKTALIKNGKNGESFEQSYDKLIISTGASAIVPKIPGSDLNNVFALRTLEDGIQIKSFIEKESPKQAAVIGAGYIGLEMAEALTKRGIQVHVFEALDQVLPYLDDDMSAMAAETLQKNGVKLYLKSMVTGIDGDGKVEKIMLSDGRTITVDLVLMSVGIRPNISFAQSGGVQIGKTGAIQINDRMQTSVMHVYAAGDCAETRCMVNNKATWVPLGTTANKQGKTAGDNASGGHSKFRGITTTSAVKIFDLEVASTGLNSVTAEKMGLSFAAVSIRSKTRAHYYPGQKDIYVKMLLNKQDGRFLGAQILGGEGVAKRIDVLATALYNKMTVQQIAELDLSYSPPFAPVWDALLVAANQALKKVRS